MNYNPFVFIRSELEQIKKPVEYFEKLFYVDQFLSLDTLIKIKLDTHVNTIICLKNFEAIDLIYSSLDKCFSETIINTKSNYPDRYKNLFEEIIYIHSKMFDRNTELPINGLKILYDYILKTRPLLYKVLKDKYNFQRIYLPYG